MNFIVVVDKNYAIGKGGDLLTYLPEDLKRFKKITQNKVVIMGRKTYESFPTGKPLPNRENIILSRDKSLVIEGVTVVNSITDLFDHIKQYNDDDVFIIGGATIYNRMMPLCKYGYITKINKAFDADTYINNVDELKIWKLIDTSEMMEYEGTQFYYTKYVNKNML